MGNSKRGSVSDEKGATSVRKKTLQQQIIEQIIKRNGEDGVEILNEMSFSEILLTRDVNYIWWDAKCIINGEYKIGMLFLTVNLDSVLTNKRMLKSNVKMAYNVLNFFTDTNHKLSLFSRDECVFPIMPYTFNHNFDNVSDYEKSIFHACRYGLRFFYDEGNVSICKASDDGELSADLFSFGDVYEIACHFSTPIDKLQNISLNYNLQPVNASDTTGELRGVRYFEDTDAPYENKKCEVSCHMMFYTVDDKAYDFFTDKHVRNEFFDKYGDRFVALVVTTKGVRVLAMSDKVVFTAYDQVFGAKGHLFKAVIRDNYMQREKNFDCARHDYLHVNKYCHADGGNDELYALLDCEYNILCFYVSRVSKILMFCDNRDISTNCLDTASYQGVTDVSCFKLLHQHFIQVFMKNSFITLTGWYDDSDDCSVKAMCSWLKRNLTSFSGWAVYVARRYHNLFDTGRPTYDIIGIGHKDDMWGELREHAFNVEQRVRTQMYGTAKDYAAHDEVRAIPFLEYLDSVNISDFSSIDISNDIWLACIFIAHNISRFTSESHKVNFAKEIRDKFHDYDFFCGITPFVIFPQDASPRNNSKRQKQIECDDRKVCDDTENDELYNTLFDAFSDKCAKYAAMNNYDSERCRKLIALDFASDETCRREFFNRVYHLTFDELYKTVVSRVVGHDSSLKLACYYVWQYLRSLIMDEKTQRNNFIIAGPSGCGKTEFMRVLRDFFSDGSSHLLPVSKIDLSMVTSEGYRGLDFDGALANALRETGSCGFGIVFLDEFDKRLVKSPTSEGSDFAAEAQYNLLTSIEGCLVQTYSRDEGRMNVIDTVNTLFVGLGTFELVRDSKVISSGQGIGFTYDANSTEEVYWSDITSNDVVEQGGKEELIGRFSDVINFGRLSDESLIEILDMTIRNRYIETKSSFFTSVVLSHDAAVKYAQYGKGKRGARDMIGKFCHDVDRYVIENMPVDNESGAYILRIDDDLNMTHEEFCDIGNSRPRLNSYVAV